MSAVQRQLFILDVGHGSCSVVKSNSAEVVVIDVGRRSTLLEFLTQNDIKNIRTIYLSHADEDHIGALVGLLSSEIVAIDRVVINSDSMKRTKVWGDLLYELDIADRKGALKFCVGLSSGDTEDLGDFEICILGPSPYLIPNGVGGVDRSGKSITSNSISAVIAVRVAGQNIAIIPGDIDGVGLDDLLLQSTDLKAPIIVYPHHGGRVGGMKDRRFAEMLLEATSPETVVFSIGRGRYGTPNPDIVRAIKESVSDARIVCTQLSEHCSKRIPPGSPVHLSSAFAEGRGRGSCCGGTIVVPLDDVRCLEPTGASHTEFIRLKVESPLCLQD